MDDRGLMGPLDFVGRRPTRTIRKGRQEKCEPTDCHTSEVQVFCVLTIPALQKDNDYKNLAQKVHRYRTHVTQLRRHLCHRVEGFATRAFIETIQEQRALSLSSSNHTQADNGTLITMRTALRCIFISILAIGAACDSNSVAPTPLPPSPEVQPGLWMASGSPSAILRLDPAQLLENASLEPAKKLTTSSAGLFTLNSIAFDTDGTMWVASEDESLLLAFSPAAASSTGPTPATVVIRPKAGSISGPSSLAFDKQHNLWVANYANGTIARFDRPTLSASGSPTPSVVISGLGHPTSLAFDAVGTLWISDNQANTISRYLVGQLLTSGEKEAAIVLSSNANSLVNPAGIAFDAAGNLWVANTGNQTVASFGIAQRGATGSPVPRLVLSPGSSPLIIPVALAFDAEGSLWVMGGSGGLKKFEPDALDGEGSQQSSVKIVVSDHVLFWSIAFWPKPAGLPLN